MNTSLQRGIGIIALVTVFGGVAFAAHAAKPRAAVRWRTDASLSAVSSHPITREVALSSGPLGLPSLNPAQAVVGLAAALSSDGTVALIGAPFASSNQGAVYVYSRTNGAWQQPVALPMTGLPTGNLAFGTSVALSSDGTVALVGAPSVIGAPYATTAGAAYVFTYSGGAWSSGVALDASGLSPIAGFGTSVALSADGTVAVVGAPQDISLLGAVHVYRLSGGTWSGATVLSTSGVAYYAGLGTSVAIDSVGDEVLVGAEGTATTTGYAYVYTYSSGVWSTPTALSITGAAVGDGVGYRVALSGDGLTALVAAPFASSSTGAVYAFSHSGSWSGSTALSNSVASSGDTFGLGLALNSDGSSALVASPFAGGSAGAVYRFTNSSGTWSGADVLSTTGVESNAYLGDGVALSSDGTVALAAARGDAPGYVYATPVDVALQASAAVTPVFAGQQGTFFVFVNNTDASRSATGVIVTDVLPAGSTYVSSTASSGSCSYSQSSGKLTCNLGTILPGNDTITVSHPIVSPQVIFTVEMPGSGGPLENKASVVADQALTGPVSSDESLIADVTPTAVAGSLSTQEGSAASGSLASNPGYAGQALTYAIATTPSHGIVKLTDAAKGTFTYTPNARFADVDFFTFSVTDGTLNSKPASETITVSATSSPGGTGSSSGKSGGGGLGWLSVLMLLGVNLFKKQKRKAEEERGQVLKYQYWKGKG